MSAAAAFKALQSQPGFDVFAFQKWESDKFAQAHGITSAELDRIMAGARPRASADRFAWLEAITCRHDLGARDLRVAMALFSFAGQQGYCWPSQRSIARRAGYEPTSNAVRDIRRSIAALQAIGAIRIVKVRNLRKDLAAKAAAPPEAGGSGRSDHGSAYALEPSTAWEKNAAMGVNSPHKYGGQQPPYNHQYNPNVLTHGDSTSPLALDSEPVSTSSTVQLAMNPEQEVAA